MEHQDDKNIIGSDSYIGRCPYCGQQNGTNYDEPHEECFTQHEIDYADRFLLGVDIEKLLKPNK